MPATVGECGCQRIDPPNRVVRGNESVLFLRPRLAPVDNLDALVDLPLVIGRNNNSLSSRELHGHAFVAMHRLRHRSHAYRLAVATEYHVAGLQIAHATESIRGR